MNAEKNIFVEREVFEKDGKSYFSYFIRGNVRGKDVRVAIIPPDKGGYTVLDIVFGSAMAAELVVKPFEIKDDATGKVISGNTFGGKYYWEDDIDVNDPDLFYCNFLREDYVSAIAYFYLDRPVL